MPVTVRGTDILFNNGTTQSTAAVVDTTSVLNATAAASVGAVGTYGLLRSANAVTVQPGGTKAGSNLRYMNAGQGPFTVTFGTSAAGTWRCMGFDMSTVDGYSNPMFYTTVWLRIS